MLGPNAVFAQHGKAVRVHLCTHTRSNQHRSTAPSEIVMRSALLCIEAMPIYSELQSFLMTSSRKQTPKNIGDWLERWGTLQLASTLLFLLIQSQANLFGYPRGR